MELKRFDLLFVRGESLISRAIQRVTHSPYSHVAVVWDTGQIVDTDWRRPLDVRPLASVRDPFDVYRYRADIDPWQAAAMNEFFLHNRGAGYDVIQTLTHALYLFTGVPLIDDARRFNCSEFVDRMFAAAGIDLCPEVDGHVTPADLARSDLLIKISR